ncbi:DUF5776 domain-containing protein [Levilactobacillus cerevisiae]|uniref:DUF5776 domain-containing protein n=1 Tax=Levilactobacillus cerevisiae TaxID=1704076 RepID=UPI000F780009|nr:DUF5776 domain-containing protein [Levilactobacillus cerevisiae]
MRFRKIHVIGLLILLVSVLSVVGSPTPAKADDATSSTTATTVTGDLPKGSVVNLAGPSSTVYPVYDLNGDVIPDKTYAGYAGYMVDQLAINLTKGGVYFRASTNEWLKIDDGVTYSAAPTNPATLTVNFVDATNTAIHPQESFNTQVDADADAIAEIKKGLLAATPVTANADQTTFTYHYTSNTPPTNPSGGNSSTGTTDSSSSSTTSTPASEPDKSAVVAVKGTAIYATKKIGLYASPDFKQATRKIWYAKTSRQERPQFIVTGYAWSQNGTLRYKIRDINHHSLTNDRRGYVTANASYVTNLYYQANPQRVKVIGKRGLNAYSNVQLSGQKLRHYQRGSVLKVKAIQKHNLTTRLVLSNGHYITGNKTLVIAK